MGRHSQVVRQRTANPLSPVQIRVSPPFLFDDKFAGVAEQADARDLKSLGLTEDRTGSIPVSGTIIYKL